MVVPTGKRLPDGTPLRVIVTPAQLSPAVAVPRTASAKNVPQDVAPGPVDTVTGSGATMVGLSVSLTVTVRLQLGPAVVELVTVVLPTGKNAPEGGLLKTTPQLPLETAASKLTAAPHWPGAFAATMVAGPGQVIVQGRHSPPPSKRPETVAL